MSDYGPLLDTRGCPLYGSRDIDILDRPDPDRPDTGRTQHTVRGARRHDAVAAVYGARSPELRAADRFRDDCAIASGAAQEGATGGLHGQWDPGRYGASDAVLDALQRARGAWQAIGLTLTGITGECILGNMKLETWCATYRRHHRTASRMLRDAISRLMEHYETLDSRAVNVAGSRHAAKGVPGTSQDG